VSLEGIQISLIECLALNKLLCDVRRYTNEW